MCLKSGFEVESVRDTQCLNDGDHDCSRAYNSGESARRECKKKRLHVRNFISFYLIKWNEMKNEIY